MKKNIIYDKYSSTIDITYKRQKVEQTGTVQTVLVLEVGKENQNKKEIILGSLESLQSFKDGVLSHDIKDMLENGDFVPELNFLVGAKKNDLVDEKLQKLYTSLKTRGFYFSNEGYRILNSESKDKINVITPNDITVSLSDEIEGPICSKYEIFKTGETYEIAEKSKLKQDLSGMINDEQSMDKNQISEKVHEAITKIIENPSIISNPPYDRVYGQMKDIVEYQHGATNKEIPEKAEDVINAFIVIYDTVSIAKAKKQVKTGKASRSQEEI